MKTKNYYKRTAKPRLPKNVFPVSKNVFRSQHDGCIPLALRFAAGACKPLQKESMHQISITRRKASGNF